MTIDPPLAAAVRRIGAEIQFWSGYGRQRISVDERILAARAGHFECPARARVSRNGSCRLLATRDGWVAVNLPRPEDRDMVSALLGEEGEGCEWARLAARLPDRTCEAVRAQGALLGLAVSILGEVESTRGRALPERIGPAMAWRSTPRVVDLSTLWAGPLCGALLAAAGCEVIRVDSLRRPDTIAQTQPAFHAQLHAAKRVVALDLACEAGRAALEQWIRGADVVITAARARGLATIGLPAALRPGVIHVAITAHGLEGPHAHRIGFGDDCAVAGGLVDRGADGAPDFVADAVADPLTGACAAAWALRALARREGGPCDVALAATAAEVARMRRGDA